jgi:hypothetical protein
MPPLSSSSCSASRFFPVQAVEKEKEKAKAKEKEKEKEKETVGMKEQQMRMDDAPQDDASFSVLEYPRSPWMKVYHNIQLRKACDRW